jgi:hypothetical protein
MKADWRVAGRRHERDLSGKELDRLHHAMSLPSTPGALEPVCDASVAQNGEALEAERGSHAVAEKPLTARSVGGFDSNACVRLKSRASSACLLFARRCATNAPSALSPSSVRSPSSRALRRRRPVGRLSAP